MCQEKNIIEKIKEIDFLITKYTKRVELYSKFVDLFHILFILSPILILLSIEFNLLYIFSITIFFMILTKYLQLRVRTLYWINLSVLYGFSEYKKELIEENYG